MNRLQYEEFKLLRLFVDICKKLNLQYYLVCGSALGAAKYGGFIPWDDDIDVALPRPEYEIFIKEAQNMLPDYVFVQNYHTEKNCPFAFTKLRNSNTTYIEKSTAAIKINHGVFIDVFPLDGYPKSYQQIELFELKKKLLQLQLSSAFDISAASRKVKPILMIFNIMGYRRRLSRTAMKLDHLFRKYSLSESVVWCNHNNWQGKLEYAPSEQYGKSTVGVFEGLPVCLPEQIDDYLAQKYGNWKAEIPDSQKEGHHYYQICDLDTSFTSYQHL